MAHQLTPTPGTEGEDHHGRTLPSTAGRSGCQLTTSVELFTQPDPGTVAAWDRLVDHTPHSDVTQLSRWSAVQRRAGFLPFYLLAHHDDRLVGGAMVLQRHSPSSGVVGYLPNGPVIPASTGRGATVRELSTALADLAQRHLGSLVIQPPEDGADVSDELLALGFRLSSAWIAPASSTRLDLTREVEHIRRELPEATRRRTHTWADRGVTVRLGCARDLPLLTDLRTDTAADPLTLHDTATLYQELNSSSHAQIFIAELDGVPVAAELFTCCGGVLRRHLSGLQRSGPARKVGVTSAVIWHAMLWAKANGFHTFDFGGCPDPFPVSFGGQPFGYPAPLELVSSPRQVDHPLRHGAQLVATGAARGWRGE